MELNRLKKIRNARDNFIRKLLERTDGAFSDKLQAILNAVERNWDDINTINRQILEKVGISDVEKEIEENEEKSLEIAIKLQKLRLSTAEGNFTLPGAQREQSAEGNSTVPGAPREQTAEGNFTLPGAQREQGAEGNSTVPGPPREQGAEGNSTVPGPPREVKHVGELIPIEEVKQGDLICFVDGNKKPQCGFALRFDIDTKQIIPRGENPPITVYKQAKKVWRHLSIKACIKHKKIVDNSCFDDVYENIFNKEANEMMENNSS